MANGKKTDQQRITATERRIKVLSYRRAGATYRQIADALAVSLATVHEDVQLAYAELRQQQNQSAEEARLLENARLDDLQRAAWSQAMNGNLKAIETVRRLMERRARLNGLDMQPGAVLMGDMEITIRWPDDRHIIDATPIDNHTAAAPQITESGSDAPGAVQGVSSGPALGQITACLSVMPDNGTE